MNRQDIRAAVLSSLAVVAPEADTSSLSPSADVRDALDIDSMDFLRFVVALNERVHVEVPERDYPKVRTVERCVEYLAHKLEA